MYFLLGNGVVPQKTEGAHSLTSTPKPDRGTRAVKPSSDSRKRLLRQESVQSPTPLRKDDDSRVVPWKMEGEALPQRSMSHNSFSSMDSAASEDSLTHPPSYRRQDTGYASNPDLSMERRDDHRLPTKLQQPLDMDRPEVREFVKKLARLIPDWRRLAFQFGFSEQEADTIETNYVMPEEQCYQMLSLWPQKYNALYSTLVEKLRKMQWDDLETMIVQHVESLAVPAQLPIHAGVLELTVDAGNADTLPCMIRALLKEYDYASVTVKIVGNKKWVYIVWWVIMHCILIFDAHHLLIENPVKIAAPNYIPCITMNYICKKMNLLWWILEL